MTSGAFDIAGDAVGVLVEMIGQVFLHFAGGHEPVDLGGAEGEHYVCAADMDGRRDATAGHSHSDTTLGEATGWQDRSTVSKGAMFHRGADRFAGDGTGAHGFHHGGAVVMVGG